MIATLDRLKALGMKLEDNRAKFDDFDKKIGFRLVPLSENDLALMSRLANDYLDESEEVLAVGQLQNYE